MTCYRIRKSITQSLCRKYVTKVIITKERHRQRDRQRERGRNERNVKKEIEKKGKKLQKRRPLKVTILSYTNIHSTRVSMVFNKSS